MSNEENNIPEVDDQEVPKDQVETTGVSVDDEAKDQKDHVETAIEDAPYNPHIGGENPVKYGNHNRYTPFIIPPIDARTYFDKVQPVMKELYQKVEEGNYRATPQELQWLGALIQAEENYPRSILERALDREGGDWQRQIRGEERNVGTCRPKIKSTGNGLLTGTDALMKASIYTGIGSPVSFPLPRSGIWLTMLTPSNADQLKLEHLLALRKMTLGKITRGRIFSQVDVYLRMALFDFALDHVVETTWHTTDKDALKAVIKQPDIDTIIHHLAVSIYPNGFPIAVPCLADPDKCKHIAEGTVALQNLWRIDNSMLSEKQKRHICNMYKRITKEDYDAYQAEFSDPSTRVFTHQYEGKKIKVAFKVPNLVEYETAGMAWISYLQMSMEQAFQQQLDAAQRDIYISDQAEITGLRQYSHWVESISFVLPNGDDDGLINDQEELALQLGVYSGDSNFAESFYGAVNNFINDTLLAITGVANFKCPSCQNRQPEEVCGPNGFKYFVPLDPMKTFFTLSTHRLQTTREVGHI